MKKQIFAFSLLIVITLVLFGCSQAADAAPTATAEPTDTKVPPTATPQPTATEVPPTATSEPTATEIPPSATPEPPTATPLPEGVLFRDDFEGSLQPGWTWENENPENWTFTDDGWLQIIGEHDSLLGENRQNNLLWYPLPEGNFVITAHLKTLPFENFHQATIYLYEDPENFIALNRGFCSMCPTGGGGFYMEYKLSGQANTYSNATDAEDVYLRLESVDNVISGYYAIEPDQWQRIGRFGNYFQFTRVGIGVTNVRAADDVVGQFDYFEISVP